MGLNLTEITLPRASPTNITYFISIDLTNNSLQDVPAGHFRVFSSSLILLNLCHNRMRSIPHVVKTDTSLRGLSWLKLCHNEVDLEEREFVHLEQLAILDLTDNVITRVRRDTFMGLENLVWLLLTRNSISVIEPHGFSHLSSMATLNLTDNALTELTDETFKGLSRLAALGLQNNELQAIHEGAFSSLTKLGGLSLAQNKLSTLPVAAFNGTRLSNLDLSMNILTELDVSIFNGLDDTLSALTLEGNRLTVFPDGFFSTVPNLNVLHLASNALPHLPDLRALTKLRMLIIYHTDISTIYECELSELTELQQIWWGLSPIACDCNLKWFRQMFDRGYSVDSSAIEESMTCYSPHELAGDQLLDLDPDSFRCPVGETAQYCRSPPNSVSQRPVLILTVVNVGTAAAKVMWDISIPLEMSIYGIRFSLNTMQNREIMNSTSFTLPAYTREFTIEQLSSNTLYNACITAMGEEKQTVAHNCTRFSTLIGPRKSRDQQRNLDVIIAVPLLLLIALIVFVTLTVYLWYKLRQTQPVGRAALGQVSSGFVGFENAVYDAQNDFAHIEQPVEPVMTTCHLQAIESSGI